MLIAKELRLSEVFLACIPLAVTLGGAHCPMGQGCCREMLCQGFSPFPRAWGAWPCHAARQHPALIPNHAGKRC